MPARPIILSLFASYGVMHAAPSKASSELFANHPASRWEHTYPIGNGSMGAMAIGSFPEERIVLNHDAIWSRPRRVELPPDSRKADRDKAHPLFSRSPNPALALHAHQP